MKKLLIIIATVMAAVLCIVAFAGCTESLKQKAIATDYSPNVSGNGGMTVAYGDYLYFINGFADSTAENTFGKAVKGSVARVKLVNGKPDGEPQIIVPKNVYGTDTKYGGLYISDDYIYYATPNNDLDGKGNPKNSQTTIMRTKVDGTDTKEILKFDDHSVVFRVVGNNLVYIRSNELHSVNLTDKKFADSTVESGLQSGYLMDDSFIYYCVTNNGDSSDQMIKVYPLSGGEAKSVLGAEIMGKTGKKYTFSILSAIEEGNNIKLFYTKTDNGVNTPDVGVYSCAFDKGNWSYNAENEKRFTHNTNSTTNLAYTNFYKAGKYYLGLSSTKLDAFNADGTKVAGGDSIESLDVGSTITVFDVEETADSVYVWYLNSSVLYRIRILSKKDGEYTFVKDNVEKIFSGSYNASYVTLEKVGSVIYYLNSSVSNNAYYYMIENGATDTAKGKILGIIIEADVIAAF